MDRRTIKAIRESKGLTQLDLAMAAEVTPATIYRLERGDRSSDGTRRRVARVLGVPVDELFVHARDDVTAGVGRGKNTGGEATSAKSDLAAAQAGG